MKKDKRKSIEIFNLSFLDVISCGFGAIILLLVISKISQPIAAEEDSEDLGRVLTELEQELNNKQNEIQAMQSELNGAEQRLVHLRNNYETKKIH